MKYRLKSFSSKKNKGSTGIIISTMFLVWLVFIAAYMMQVHLYSSVATDTEDALASANLASAVIDIRQFGRDHSILINDVAGAYAYFSECLQANMNLDQNFVPLENVQLITSQVDVTAYVVYNVHSDGTITVHVNGSDPSGISAAGGSWYEDEYGVRHSNVVSPNGIEITETSIYSRVKFHVKGMLGLDPVANFEQLTDIVLGETQRY